MRPLPFLRLATAFLALTGPALAQESGPGSVGEALGQIFEGVKLRPSPPPPADFVVKSRPAELDYAPLATPGAGPQTKAKTAREIKSLERELGGAAAANRSRAARIRVPDGSTPGGKRRSSAEAQGSAARQN